MISAARAWKLIEKNTPRLGREVKPLKHLLGSCLAGDVYSPVPLPLDDNSAMDGYALRSRDVQTASRENPVVLEIRGTCKAGDRRRALQSPRSALKIMTGALIPRGADAVIAKEDTQPAGDRIIVCRPVPRGNHIRRRGEEIRTGRRVLREGSPVHPGTLAVLASLGMAGAAAHRKPRVSVITTGNELTGPGRIRQEGRIFDSNTWTVVSALAHMGLPGALAARAGDDPAALNRAVEKALGQSDAVILSGGVSVGDYDFVRDCLEASGVRTIFWRVLQKPGKPLFFGKRKNQVIFGLPGNPAAVFMCFYEYVYPALRRMSGFRHPRLPRRSALLGCDVSADRERVLYLKAKLLQRNGGPDTVLPLGHQASHMITPLHEMNCIALVPARAGLMRAGEDVSVDLLPFGAAW